MAFKMNPVITAAETILRYTHDAWPGEEGSWELDGREFEAVFRYTISLLPAHVTATRHAHLRGADVPREPSGRSVTPQQTLAALTHAAFLEDPAPIAAVMAPHLAWPEVLEEARYILLKAREEGRWRRRLEVRNTAAQIDTAVAAIRAGKALQTSAPYTSLTYWWDEAAGAFMERAYTAHPYGGEDRHSKDPVSEEKLREVLEGLPGAHLEKVLR